MKIWLIRIALFVSFALVWSVSVGNDVIAKGKTAYEAQQYAQAIDYFSAPASQGQSDAQFWTGLSFEALNDYPHAKLWLRKAAEQGYAEAQVTLGLIAYQADSQNAPPMEATGRR